MNCVIVGAGQLGSRHLQAILKYDKCDLVIYVIDNSLKSLQIAKERTDEIKHSHNVIFSDELNHIPNDIFLSIVATNSKEREFITIKLLTNYRIKFLLLEKVLFPEMAAYDNVSKILNIIDTKCYVNHARRLFKGYNYLRNNYSINSNLNIQIAGSNWGLACNALHYIDIIEYITNQKLKNIDTSYIDKILLQSKRNGYVEFTGTIYGCLDNNINFSISSFNNESITAPAICIMSGANRIFIQESDILELNIYLSTSSFVLNKMEFEIPYQSSITNLVLDDLINTGNTNLPSYNEASHSHRIFIEEMLKFYNNLNGNINNSIIPIT